MFFLAKFAEFCRSIFHLLTSLNYLQRTKEQLPCTADSTDITSNLFAIGAWAFTVNHACNPLASHDGSVNFDIPLKSWVTNSFWFWRSSALSLGQICDSKEIIHNQFIDHSERDISWYQNPSFHSCLSSPWLHVLTSKIIKETEYRLSESNPDGTGVGFDFDPQRVRWRVRSSVRCFFQSAIANGSGDFSSQVHQRGASWEMYGDTVNDIFMIFSKDCFVSPQSPQYVFQPRDFETFHCRELNNQVNLMDKIWQNDNTDSRSLGDSLVSIYTPECIDAFVQSAYTDATYELKKCTHTHTHLSPSPCLFSYTSSLTWTLVRRCRSAMLNT